MSEDGPRGEDTSRAESGSSVFSEDREFSHELERRLDILEAPDYEDPARVDLPAIDLILLAAVVVLTTLILYVWGY